MSYTTVILLSVLYARGHVFAFKALFMSTFFLSGGDIELGARAIVTLSQHQDVFQPQN